MNRSHEKADRTGTVTKLIDRMGGYQPERMAAALQLDEKVVNGWGYAMEKGIPIHMPDGVYIKILEYLETHPPLEKRMAQVQKEAGEIATAAISLLETLQNAQKPEEPANIVKRLMRERKATAETETTSE